MKATRAAIKTASTLERVEMKLDLLLKAAGIDVEAANAAETAPVLPAAKELTPAEKAAATRARHAAERRAEANS